MSEARKQIFADYFGSNVSRDLFSLCVGDHIGSGTSRKVFAWDLDKSLVVKIETGHASFSNIREWELWNEIKETPFAKWFAPCVSISACGSILLMKRTIPARYPKEYPTRLPVFLTDLKLANYGRLNGKFVCHDYGNALLMQTGLTKKMRKVEWWGD